MRIVFFGSGAFGVPTLTSLLRTHEVVGVVTQPDRPVGRGKKLTPTPIGQAIEQLSPETPVFKPENINTPEAREAVRSIECDAWVVIAYGQYLGQKLLADRFAINLHASLLPRWRGAAPINAAVIHGDTETGTSVIAIAKEMDAGDVFATTRRAIEPHQTAGELHDLLAEDGVSAVDRVLDDLAADALCPCAQDPELVTLAPKMTKTDGAIDFVWSANRCRCVIHGTNPWPSTSVRYGDLPIKLHRAEALSQSSDATPGTIIDAGEGLVSCGTGVLRLLEVQPAGKKAMPWSDFARGRAIEPGSTLSA